MLLLAGLPLLLLDRRAFAVSACLLIQLFRGEGLRLRRERAAERRAKALKGRPAPRADTACRWRGFRRSWRMPGRAAWLPGWSTTAAPSFSPSFTRVISKLGARDRVQLVATAHEAGLVRAGWDPRPPAAGL